MIASIFRLSTILFGVAILITGHGLQLAFIPLRIQMLGWTSAQGGILSSLYFVGFLCGCFVVPNLVNRVGHIRCFAVLTSVMSVSILCLGLYENFYFWIVLRVVTGFAIVGLYLVIESWLNSEVTNEVRGSVLATYTVIILAGLAVGQLLMNTTAVDGFQILMFASILITLAAVPVCLTSSTQPSPIPNATFSPLLVLKTSRAAALGAVTAGIVSGSIYGLGGIYGSQVGLDVSSISIMMALSIAGGALAQLPLGKLSDRYDRRLVILGCMTAGAIISSIALLVPISMVYVVMFFFGAAVMSLQALSLALASDNTTNGNFMEVGTGLMMTNAAGSAIGPLLTSLLMYRFGPEYFFISHFAVLLIAALTVAILIKTKPAASEHPSNFKLATSASAQAALQLDERADAEVEDDDLAKSLEEDFRQEGIEPIDLGKDS
ncbi:MAG: MFS family permease [Pseudohongiellaceae bacterium]